jgi:nucleoside-diphosphate-sugar epimerase
MTDRVVLFGGHGFVGRWLRGGLEGDVLAPTRSEVDLLDHDQLLATLRPGDIVINAAGYASATDRSADGLAQLRRDNVDGPLNLARAAARAGVRQMIHISSVAAMGQREGRNLVEGDMRPPRSPYGQSKLDAELALATVDHVPITILRPTSVFGEGRGLAALLLRISRLPVVPLPRGGAALIPFTYVANVVAAVRAAMGRDACYGGTFIVGDATSYPLRDIVRELGAAAGRGRRPILTVPRSVVGAIGHLERGVRTVIGGPALLDPIRQETLTCSVSYSIAAFQRATGFEPPFSLQQACARLAARVDPRAA